MEHENRTDLQEMALKELHLLEETWPRLTPEQRDRWAQGETPRTVVLPEQYNVIVTTGMIII
jgi:hypothetical protein